MPGKNRPALKRQQQRRRARQAAELRGTDPATALELGVLRVVDDCVSRLGKAPLLRVELVPALARMAGVDEATAWAAVARCLAAGWLAGTDRPRSSRVHPSARAAVKGGSNLYPLAHRHRARGWRHGEPVFPPPEGWPNRQRHRGPRAEAAP